jgi:branched-chain amino acid transport system substrate-binding protein
LYAPFTYDAANLLVDAMKKANSVRSPPGICPNSRQAISYAGATGKIEFDDKGDRKDAEMTIFTHEGRQDHAAGDHQGRRDDQLRGLSQGRGSGAATVPAAGTAPSADAPKASDAAKK